MILEILTYTHNITTMLFGIFLSAFFLGVKKDKTNVGKLLLLAVISGGLYMVCVSVLGPEMVDQIYPLIVHVPLLLMLVLYYKFRILPSLISIFTAYLCCQCSNWMGLFVLSVTRKRVVLLHLPYRGDAGGILGIVPLCLPDDGDAVCQDESGITADRKSAADILYF